MSFFFGGGGATQKGRSFDMWEKLNSLRIFEKKESGERIEEKKTPPSHTPLWMLG